jgi:hypothetical protein
MPIGKPSVNAGGVPGSLESLRPSPFNAIMLMLT